LRTRSGRRAHFNFAALPLCFRNTYGKHRSHVSSRLHSLVRQSRPPLCSRPWVCHTPQRNPHASGQIAWCITLTISRLWGNPEHLKHVSTSLRERFPEEKLVILVAKRNAGSFTYDGVDTGGERVASEVEQKLEELAKDGHDITKISFVGYSLGGLVARFAIGLLYSRGVFEAIQPVV
jgi:hypothetical protein